MTDHREVMLTVLALVDRWAKQGYCDGLTPDEDRAIEALRAALDAPEGDVGPVANDPCPQCFPGRVCRTPKCGRLKLPISHPVRNPTPPQDAEPTT